MLTLYICRFEMKFLSVWKSKALIGVVHLIAVWRYRILDITCGGPYNVLNVPSPFLPP